MNVYWDEARKTAEYDHDHYHDQFYCADDLMTLMINYCSQNCNSTMSAIYN